MVKRRRRDNGIINLSLLKRRRVNVLALYRRQQFFDRVNRRSRVGGVNVGVASFRLSV